jgi:NAD(P)-dependent dehydrogenase (short-subunit alcohol dehydrogenase family)
MKKTCIITGANSGIGKAATAQLTDNGHRVIMACRNQQRGEAALEEIKQTTGSDAVELMIVDMSLQSSIREFAKQFLVKYQKLDVLIHNAAAFDTRQKEIIFTEERVEKIWATNHIGPVLLTNLLMDALMQSKQGRVITISSKGLTVFPRLQVDLEDPEFQEQKFSVQKAYYQSKLAQVMYTYWLADQMKNTSVTANSIRVTNVRIDVDKQYSGLPTIMRKMYAIKSLFAITPEKMAETYTYLATSDDVKQTTGVYFDNPQRIVNSSEYSRDPENIEKVMTLTKSFIK